MKLDNADLIEEFYESIKDKYPVSLEQTKEICFSPFRFLKEVMESGSLEDVRLKYFGNFVVHKKRVEAMYRSNEVQFKKNKMSKEVFDFRQDMLNKYLKRNEDKI